MRRKSLPLYIKILLIVFLNVYVVCWLFAWQVLRSSQDILMEKAYESAVGVQTSLCGNIKSFAENVFLLSGNGGYEQSPAEIVKSVVSSYDKKYLGDTTGCRVEDASGKVVYEGKRQAVNPVQKLSTPEDGSVEYQLQRTSEGSVITVSSYLEVGSRKFRVDYWEDVTGLLKRQRTFAIRTGVFLAGISLVLLVSLYFSIRRALFPLKELGEQAKSMAEGNYNLRVLVRGNDEVGALAEDFNHMVEAVQERTEMLKETARLRELYAANLAHEIKSPMTSIIGYSQMAMLLEQEPQQRYEMLSYIHKEGKRLDALSSTLLKWSELNQEKELNRCVFAVERMVKHFRLLIKPLLDENGQQLVVENELEQLNADENLIITLLRNLVANAARASEKGAVIYVYFKMEKEENLIIVEDQGIGIQEEELKKIREPFYIIDKARTRANKGAGLGLALCDAIVRAHGGTMEIESVPGQGTIVTVRLPLYPS